MHQARPIVLLRGQLLFLSKESEKQNLGLLKLQKKLLFINRE